MEERELGQYLRRAALSRLHAALSMACAADIVRAADFLEFANQQKRGKKQQRAFARAAQQQRMGRRGRAA